LLGQAIEAEVTSFLESHADKLTADGDRRLVSPKPPQTKRIAASSASPARNSPAAMP
jgi:hypothetical protein